MGPVPVTDPQGCLARSRVILDAPVPGFFGPVRGGDGARGGSGAAPPEAEAQGEQAGRLVAD